MFIFMEFLINFNIVIICFLAKLGNLRRGNVAALRWRLGEARVHPNFPSQPFTNLLPRESVTNVFIASLGTLVSSIP